MDGLASTGPKAPTVVDASSSVPGLNYHAAGRCSHERTPSWARTGPCTTFATAPAYRMARDPRHAADRRAVGPSHAHLSTTQLYVTAPLEDVVETVLAHHRPNMTNAFSPARASRRRGLPAGDLDVLFGRKAEQ